MFNILLKLILLVVIGDSIIPLRLYYRRKQMQMLAKQFSLSFRDNSTIFDYYKMFSIFFHALKPDERLNNIEGVNNSHHIVIYDNFKPSPIFLVNYRLRFTVVEIDQKRIRGGYETLELGDSYLTPIATLRKILKT